MQSEFFPLYLWILCFITNLHYNIKLSKYIFAQVRSYTSTCEMRTKSLSLKGRAGLLDWMLLEPCWKNHIFIGTETKAFIATTFYFKLQLNNYELVKYSVMVSCPAPPRIIEILATYLLTISPADRALSGLLSLLLRVSHRERAPGREAGQAHNYHHKLTKSKSF